MCDSDPLPHPWPVPKKPIVNRVKIVNDRHCLGHYSEVSEIFGKANIQSWPAITSSKSTAFKILKTIFETCLKIT